MTEASPFPPSYLAWKRSIDDRSLDQRVWRELRRRLESVAARGESLSVLEVGAGIGAMVDRLLPTLDCLTDSVRYVALEPDAQNAAVLRSRADSGLEVVERALFENDDSLGADWDLVVACAVLDLLPLAPAVGRLFELTAPGGLLYLPICFDGVTAFEPRVDPVLDAEIERCYHRSMEDRRVDGQPTGGAHSGRRLLSELRRGGFEVLAAAGSDWVVFADGQGRYPDEEARFLRHMVEGVAEAVGPYLDDSEGLGRWAELRLGQIERGELVLITHQLDLLARKP